MREKLKSLPLTELKQIAKENHIKNVSTLRKAQLIDVILERLSPELCAAILRAFVPTVIWLLSEQRLIEVSADRKVFLFGV